MTEVAGGGDSVANRVAYVVLTHHKPAQILRLVDRLLRSDPTGVVVVSHDTATFDLDLGRYADHPRVHTRTQTSRRRWGSYALVDDLLQTLFWTAHNVDVQWLTVLSGQDYPVRSLARFGPALAESGYDAFVTAAPAPESRPVAADSGALYTYVRYFFRWYELPRWLLGWARGDRVLRLLGSLQRRLSASQPFVFIWSLPAGGGDMIGFRRRTPPFTDDFRCFKGSQWFTLSRDAATAMARFLQARPGLTDAYRRMLIADESLPVTVLCNDIELRVRQGNHHFVRMTGGGDAHAAVLTVADLDSVRRSDRWFARKFDESVDAEVLDRLDELVLAAF